MVLGASDARAVKSCFVYFTGDKIMDNAFLPSDSRGKRDYLILEWNALCGKNSV